MPRLGRLRCAFVAAVAIVMSAAAVGPLASAQDRGGHGRGERSYGRPQQGYGSGGGRPAPPRAGPPANYARGPYPPPPAPYAPPAYGRGGGYGGYEARPYPGEGGGRYGAPFVRPGGAYEGFRRGQVMPPSYTGGAMVDPRAYHLRRPPIGYGWVVVGPNAYLLQRSSGMILDTAPLY